MRSEPWEARPLPIRCFDLHEVVVRDDRVTILEPEYTATGLVIRLNGVRVRVVAVSSVGVRGAVTAKEPLTHGQIAVFGANVIWGAPHVEYHLTLTDAEFAALLLLDIPHEVRAPR